MASNVLLSSQMMTPSRKSWSHQKDSSRDLGEDDSLAVPLHPLKIKPSGNAYTAPENIKQAAGVFVGLPDELIIQIMEYLDATSLKWLGSTSKALYAFSRLEDLWKTLCLEYEFPLSLFHFVYCDPDLYCFGLHAVLYVPAAPWATPFVMLDCLFKEDVYMINT